MTGHYEPQLIDGWKFDEVASALQKSIRRGMEYESVFWAFVIHKSNFGPYLWRRLSVICSEDVGNGNPQAVLVLNALKNNWEDLHKNNKEPTLDKFLLVAHAILHLCRSQKSRETDNLVNLIDENYKSNKWLAIPKFSIDPHCNQGRKIFGRFGDLTDGKEEERIRLWDSEWSMLDKLAYTDKWKDEVLRIWLDRAKTRKNG